MAALQEQAHVAHRRGVGVVGGETFDARSQAAMDVVLQAGFGMAPLQIHLAGGHQEVAVDEMHQPVRQVGREVRAEIRGAVLAQPPRHVHPRILLVGELDVGVGLVVAQQDVEARLVLLDEVVLERQRFLLVIDQDVVEIGGLRDQGAGLDIGQLVLGEVTAHAQPQALGLAHVDDASRRVLVEIYSGRERKLAWLYHGVPSEGLLLLYVRRLLGHPTRLEAEIVEPADARHHARQGRRNGWIGGIGVVHLAANLILVNRRAEGVGHLRGRAAETD